MKKTSERIVAAARRAFYETGYQQTSLADLADVCGVPKGNFYYHFKSKDAVLTAVAEARGRDLRAAISRWREELATPRRRIARVVAMMSDDREALVRFGCPIGSLVTELGKRQEDLKRACVAQTMDVVVEFVAEQLVVVGHPADAARELALRLLARCQGAVLVAQAYGDADVLAREVDDILDWVAELTEAEP